jgi:RNA polymerase sigma-70 factor (ECF subfamily)
MATARSIDAFREVHPGAAPSNALESALSRAFEAGRAAWAGIAIGEAEFARYLAERVGPDEDPRTAVDRLHTADLYLACACASGDPRAVEVFTRRLLADVRSYLFPVGAADLSEDVRQILLERLFVGSEDAPPKIAAYSGHGQLAAWVRVSAVRIALSLRRGERASEASPADDALDPLLPAVDPELDALKLRYADEFNAALRDAFAALPSRDRALLKLHYVDGVPVERIATAYNAHRVSASRWLSAARARVLEETSRLIRERRRLTESEFESLARLVRSQLELSLRSAIGGGDG